MEQAAAILAQADFRWRIVLPSVAIIAAPSGGTPTPEVCGEIVEPRLPIQVPEHIRQARRAIAGQHVADHAVELETDLVVIHRVLGVAAEIDDVLADRSAVLQTDLDP